MALVAGGLQLGALPPLAGHRPQSTAATVALGAMAKGACNMCFPLCCHWVIVTGVTAAAASGHLTMADGAKGAIIASMTCDAAATGVQWIYDLDTLAQLQQHRQQVRDAVGSLSEPQGSCFVMVCLLGRFCCGGPVPSESLYRYTQPDMFVSPF